MKYRLYLRVKMQDDSWVKIGKNHEIQWDNRDLIKASSGWLIVNQDKIGMASDFVPKLHRGIMELQNSQDSYREYEMIHGLGTIKSVLSFYEELLSDCQRYPYTELCGCVSN
jgi:hypothetical protein